MNAGKKSKKQGGFRESNPGPLRYSTVKFKPERRIIPLDQTPSTIGTRATNFRLNYSERLWSDEGEWNTKRSSLLKDGKEEIGCERIHYIQIMFYFTHACCTLGTVHAACKRGA